MKGNTLTYAPLCLLYFWLLPISSMKSSNQAIPLSMVEDAVDDMYFSCNAKMEKMVREKYFKEETRPNSMFEKIWKEADTCANNSLNTREDIDQALTKDHMQAICVYTSPYEEFYKKFNEAVRTHRKNYSTSFPYHSLHFWLTSAVQILRNDQDCWDTYRRTSVVFTGSVNQVIRFGSFASSSLLADLKNFGRKTCFQIKTCFGAYLKHYSYFKDKEQEVLIPPYEMFKITTKARGTGKLADCQVVYFLESVGLQSNLNCYAVNSKPSKLSVWRNKLKAGSYHGSITRGTH